MRIAHSSPAGRTLINGATHIAIHRIRVHTYSIASSFMTTDEYLPFEMHSFDSDTRLLVRETIVPV